MLFSAQASSGPFVPQLQMSVGKDYKIVVGKDTKNAPIYNTGESYASITSIPPEYLREFKFTSRLGEHYTVNVSLFDPTYETLEQLLLTNELKANEVVEASQQFSLQFGVINPISGTDTWSEDIICVMKSYVPMLSAGGLDISLELLAWQLAPTAFDLKPRQFYGKRSQVIEQIAKLYGWYEASKNFIEETDDDGFERVRGVLNPAVVTTATTVTTAKSQFRKNVWSTNNMTISQFVQDRIIPGSRSKADKKTAYIYDLDTSGKLIRFAPLGSKKLGCAEKPVKRFNFLAGCDSSGLPNSDVLSWSPDFKGNILGQLGAGGSLVRHYNPATKQFENITLTASTVTDILVTGKTRHVGTRKPDQLLGIGGYSTYDPVEARATAETAYNDLASSLYQGSLVLYGSDKTLSIRGGDIIRLDVVLPSGTTHWSSGYWMVMQAVHSLSDHYTVTLDLFRNYGDNVGAYKAEYGAEMIEDFIDALVSKLSGLGTNISDLMPWFSPKK